LVGLRASLAASDKKILEPRYFDIQVRNLRTTPTELTRNLFLKFTLQISDTAKARNLQVASTAFHCYSSRNFREEARTDNQTENNALPITFFLFLRRSYPILRPGLPLRGFAITLIGHTTLGKTPSDHSDAQTRHNTCNRQTSSPLVKFELTIPANERPQTDALDRAATGIDPIRFYVFKI
jgi:hypothetical protein